MHFFKKFMPDVFNLLTVNEKKEIITDLANYLCDDMQLDHISVTFGDDFSDENNNVLGKLHYFNPFIMINDIFINNDKKKQQEIFNKELNLYVFVPYYLMHTVAHECYHYHQYNMVKNLLNGKLTNPDDKDKAYLYFICLYSEVFYAFCKEKNLPIDEANISQNDIYRYSPIEIEAESYANSVTSVLENIDYSEYAKYNTLIKHTNILDFWCYDIDNGENLTIESIKSNLKLALTFLNNCESRYLNIDIVELEESVKRALNYWKEKEETTVDLTKKILKK